MLEEILIEVLRRGQSSNCAVRELVLRHGLNRFSFGCKRAQLLFIVNFMNFLIIELTTGQLKISKILYVWPIIIIIALYPLLLYVVHMCRLVLQSSFMFCWKMFFEPLWNPGTRVLLFLSVNFFTNSF